MFSLLFRHRRFALVWVLLTLASVAAFVGKDGGADMIAKNTRRIEAQRKMLSQPSPPTAAIVRVPREDAPPPDLPQLQAAPGSAADPDHPKVGDVFVDPLTGQRLRVVRRSDLGATGQPGQPDAYSSSAASP